jgi:uncharacterized protein (DUF1697 family)
MRLVALLRGINVGGNRKVPMAELRSIAVESGFTQVETYINSGNLIFDSGKRSAAKAATHLEAAIHEHFGFALDVIARTDKEWEAYAAGSPFPKAARDRPNLVMIGLSKLPLGSDTAARLRERTAENERVEVVNGAIWVDFGGGAGRSALTPAWFDKAAGSPVTLRNWRTVLKLGEMLLRKSAL